MRNRTGSRQRKKGRLLIRLGVSLILVGLLSIAGVYSYIYYTDRVAARAQNALFEEWEEGAAAIAPAPGEPVGRIISEKLGLDAIIVELASLDDAENLKRGPGHLPMTPLPGQPGNVVVSGHRTTYGAPFMYINELVSGDLITVEARDATFIYEVYEQRIVEPTDLTVLEQEGEPKLTLTACHPWYSAKQRIVVIARLVPGS
ncbi:MAG: class E sortase [Candidatus Geothermincolia bacterium]